VSDPGDAAMDAEQDRYEAEQDEKRRQRALVEPSKACARCSVLLDPDGGDFCDDCQRIEEAVILIRRGLSQMREGRTIDGMRCAQFALTILEAELEP
jgi:hypothetical protein